METTFDPAATDKVSSSGRRLMNDASDSVNNIKTAASGEIKSLIADVEDLVARIADLKDGCRESAQQSHARDGRGERRIGGWCGYDQAPGATRGERCG